MKDIKGRNEQFIKIAALKRYYLSRGYAVLSIDTKKKEYLGPFYRPGQVYGDAPLRCYDHDFNSFATGKIVPYGIYDLGRNEGHMFIGNSADTAEFVGQCLRDWWKNKGRKVYNPSQPILILTDGGGSNASRSHLFKEELQKFSSQTGLIIRMAHYPSYCSKYNPIEHRLFPTITRTWSGVMLDSVETVVELIRKRAKNLKSGLRVFVKAVDKTFEKGKRSQKIFGIMSTSYLIPTVKNGIIAFSLRSKSVSYLRHVTKPRTADNLLKKLVEQGILTQPDYGSYKKK